ncbi:predicted protein [Sclerotinia sclerotiorum 1980 UF-70]|uniref:Uncharacterized protein n=1 Tax=Sclerotinia sclerotiorum (strain ATCC 18683 / 1980 / Ss-1) TaxID=665079 RepID=A7ELZ7_SCLS1|nr:predicted protein [Sclerotinia sclerotiorum 1980 UF-70]EDO03863.1 predicted protein [Sclerotinia sclerotiorum 1980 UF-70]
MNNGKEEWRWVLRRFHVDIRRKKKPAEAIPFSSSFFPAAMNLVGPRRDCEYPKRREENLQHIQRESLRLVGADEQTMRLGHLRSEACNIPLDLFEDK